jgi:hypothetical protein
MKHDNDGEQTRSIARKGILKELLLIRMAPYDGVE